ncbi:MAG TPA: hypothetical protein VFS40_04475 [Gemmatimonadales bacterium]|nr:hypothetical protein [Gemmatimonadales bacterium]
MRGRHLIAGLAAALLLGACGGDKTGPNGDGGDNGNGGNTGGTSFSATVSGGITMSLSGGAYYGDGDDGTTEGGFALVLGLLDTDPKPKAWVGIGRDQGGEPAVGKYPFFNGFDGETEASAGDFRVMAQFYNGDAEDDWCTGTGGELEITSSSSDRVKGKFTATLACLPLFPQDGDSPKMVTISGQFDSKKAVVPSPDF